MIRVFVKNVVSLWRPSESDHFVLLSNTSTVSYNVHPAVLRTHPCAYIHILYTDLFRDKLDSFIRVLLSFRKQVDIYL